MRKVNKVTDVAMVKVTRTTNRIEAIQLKRRC